jgi:MFS family permease
MFRRSSFFEPLRQNPRLIPLLVMICLIMAGMGLVAPVLSLYAKTFQVATTLIGMVITIFGVGRIAANYPAGYLSQIIGRRPLLAVGASTLVVSSIGAALARDFTTLIVWRFIEGFGSGIYMTCSLAALADTSTPQTRAHVMSLYQTAQLAGAMIGPAIGGWFAYHYGYTAPFWAYAGIACLVLVTSFVSFEDSRQPLPRKHSVEATAGGGLMTIPFAASCLMGGVSFFTRTATQYQLIPLIAYDDLHLNVDVIGLALMVSYLAWFMLLPLAGIIIDRFGSRSCVLWSSLGLAGSLAIIFLGNNWFWIAMVAIGLAQGILGPATNTYGISVIPREKFGPGMGVQRTISDVGFVAGPLVVGLIDGMGGLGHSAGLVASILLLVGGGAVFWFGTRGGVDDMAGMR